jgi:hypothetical protein
MAGMKRIIITDEDAVKALNLMSAVTGEEGSAIAARAVMAVWREKAEQVLSEVRQLSPLSGHVAETEKVESGDSEKAENKPEDQLSGMF